MVFSFFYGAMVFFYGAGVSPQELNTDVTMALLREVLKDPEWRQALGVSGVSGVGCRRMGVWLRGSPFSLGK